ncbi:MULTISPECIES: Mce protein [unclassified Mycobacterium]|uniref:Mce protein n=1 Tax=unclassified Mycobacterium TaxID=2642494 RepID=UPI0029C77A33|nr:MULTISPECIES: Mce protein [unclassified Mycobacterium]
MAKHDAAPKGQLNEPDAVADSATDADSAVEHTDGHRAKTATAADCEAKSDDDAKAPASKKRMSPAISAMTISLLIVVVVGALAGFLGFQTYQSEQAQHRDNLFLEVARQGAINLTTIDWQEADADISRILESATGTFYDDFSKRSQPFVEVVKQAQSKSVGTVTEAGLESESGDQAQVLVAVSVKTTNLGAEEQRPRAWRMRIDVQKVGDQAKVSDVQFVP